MSEALREEIARALIVRKFGPDAIMISDGLPPEATPVQRAALLKRADEAREDADAILPIITAHLAALAGRELLTTHARREKWKAAGCWAADRTGLDLLDDIETLLASRAASEERAERAEEDAHIATEMATACDFETNRANAHIADLERRLKQAEEALGRVHAFIQQDVSSGDDLLWTDEYGDLAELVAAAIRARTSTDTSADLGTGGEHGR